MTAATTPRLGRLMRHVTGRGPDSDHLAALAGLAEDLVFTRASRGEPYHPGLIVKDLIGTAPPGLDPYYVETAAAVARRAAEHAAEVCRAAARLAMICPHCGGDAVPGPGVGPHFGQLRCPKCVKHLRWIKKPVVAGRCG